MKDTGGTREERKCKTLFGHGAMEKKVKGMNCAGDPVIVRRALCAAAISLCRRGA